MKIGLSLDGGGVRGYVSALIMQEIEKRIQNRIDLIGPEVHLINFIDSVAGNSTGSILTALLTIPADENPSGIDISYPKYSLNDIVGMYKEFAPAVFKKFTPRYILSLGGLLTYRYSSKTYEKLLDGYFGNTTLDKCIKDVMFVTYNVTDNRPFFFKRRHALNPRTDLDNEFLTNIVRCSSAAQTYFSPKVLGNDKVFVDGLLTTNNPSLCLYTEMKKHYPDEDIVIINIGTGSYHESYNAKRLLKAGLIGWAVPLFNMLTSSAEDLVKYEMNIICDDKGNDKFFNLNPVLPPEAMAMDDASDAQLKRLYDSTKQWIIKNDNLIENIVDIICSNEIN